MTETPEELTYTIIKCPKGGWAVRCNKSIAYLAETRTKHAAQKWIDDALRTRAEIRAHRQAQQDRIRERNLILIQPHDVRPGDTIFLSDNEGMPTRSHLIGRVQRLDSGGAMLYHQDAPPPGRDQFTLATPGRALFRQEQPAPAQP